MRNDDQPEAEDSSMAIGNTLASLQNQLLIELLKKNINAISKTCSSSQDPFQLISPFKSSASIHLPSSCADEQVVDKHAQLLQVCDNIDKMVGTLSQIQHKICAQADKQRTDELTVKNIRLFLEKIQSVKSLLKNNHHHHHHHHHHHSANSVSFELVKGNIISVTKYLQGEKQRLEGLNEDYVNRIAEGRVQFQELGFLLLNLLELIQSMKKELLSMPPNVTNIDWDSCVQRLIDLTIQEYTMILQCVHSNIANVCVHHDFYDDFNSISSRVSSMSETLSVISDSCTRKLADYKRENQVLRTELNQLKNLCDSQQLAAMEISRKYEEEVNKLSAELDASKSREQTTPPTSVTRKRRVLVDTVIAFTGLSKDPTLVQELSLAIVELGGRVHASADFTTDITHVVCPTGYHSVRTMAAALSSKWIISVDWIVQSKKAGKLLSEAAFGRLFPNGPSTLRCKSFFLTAKFISQQARHQMNAACCKTLIEPIGKGKVTDDLNTTDYVLCGDGEERRGRNWLRLKDFIRMIPGHSTD